MREFVAMIDVDELELRIAEACMSNKRPPGMSAKEALRELQAIQDSANLPCDAAAGFHRAAFSVAQYFADALNAAQSGMAELRQVHEATKQ